MLLFSPCHFILCLCLFFIMSFSTIIFFSTLWALVRNYNHKWHSFGSSSAMGRFIFTRHVNIKNYFLTTYVQLNVEEFLFCLSIFFSSYFYFRRYAAIVRVRLLTLFAGVALGSKVLKEIKKMEINTKFKNINLLFSHFSFILFFCFYYIEFVPAVDNFVLFFCLFSFISIKSFLTHYTASADNKQTS